MASRKPTQRSLAEQAFEVAWERFGGQQRVFAAPRKWAFDFAFPDQMLAVEIDGFGRHQLIGGWLEDCHKLNEATRRGWRVFRFPARDKGKAVLWVKMVLEALGQ
jgi:very-short-patch-repair endonuclease